MADAMRVRAGVAPRVASGDRAASKSKSAGGCSSFKRRVGQEERCAATHARSDRPWCVCACAQNEDSWPLAVFQSRFLGSYSLMAVFSRNVPNSAAAVCCCWILVLQIPELSPKMAV
eukprot:COSAG06_NODE_21281_length_763_cov_0.506024_1_plen_116_part_01